MDSVGMGPPVSPLSAHFSKGSHPHQNGHLPRGEPCAPPSPQTPEWHECRTTQGGPFGPETLSGPRTPPRLLCPRLCCCLGQEAAPNHPGHAALASRVALAQQEVLSAAHEYGVKALVPFPLLPVSQRPPPTPRGSLAPAASVKSGVQLFELPLGWWQLWAL